MTKKAGVNHYFIKPVDPETIEALLRDPAATQMTQV
jgi:hypothetical protein